MQQHGGLTHVGPSISAPQEDDVSCSDREDDGIELEDESRKRKRAKTGQLSGVSCERCKFRKVRCDRKQPSCGWCVRNEQLCNYTERKRPGLRAGYGKELEARLDNLESILQTQQSVLQRVASLLPGGQLTTATSPQILATDDSQGASHTGAALFVEAGDSHEHPNSDMSRHSCSQIQSSPDQTLREISGKQDLNLHRERQSRSQVSMAPPSDGYTPGDPPIESPSLNIVSPSTQRGPNGDGAADIDLKTHDLPPKDLLYALTDLFFSHINTWCPILQRRSTLDALFGPSPLDEADRVVLHAIVATTMRFSTDTRLTEQARTRYHAASKQRVLLYGLENSSVKALQALVILALDIIGTSNGPPAWNLMALLARSVVQLGLAVELTSTSVSPMFPSIYTLRAMVLPKPESFIEEEARRRLFWIIYLLDRYVTIATAFEFALDDKDIDLKLPCKDELWSRNQLVETRWFRPLIQTDWDRIDNPENLGPFSYYIEILAILTDIHRFLKKPVDIGALFDVERWQQEYRQLDSKLREWRHSLPVDLSDMVRVISSTVNPKKSASCMWIMLHTTYSTTVIRLHSSAAYPTTRSPIFTPSFSASQQCLAAAKEICKLCTHVRSNNLLDKLGPPFAFSLWVAARLLLVHGSTIDHKVDSTIELLVDTMRDMGLYWNIARRYATLLQRVLDEYSDSAHAPIGATGVRETPSTVRILADMRRCAYDLDFLISRQPQLNLAPMSNIGLPHTPIEKELEYLDVFDFFNRPRLPYSAPTDSNVAADSIGDMPQEVQTSIMNEFNITDFMYDANSDWFTST